MCRICPGKHKLDLDGAPVYLQVDIPEEDGGLPGRRTVGAEEDDRSRTFTKPTTSKTSSANKAVASPTAPGTLGLNTTNVESVEETVEHCNQLEKEDISEFYQKCCLHKLARDSRCALTTLLAAYNEQQKEVRIIFIETPYNLLTLGG